MIDLKVTICFFIASIILILGFKSVKHVFIKLAKTTLQLLDVLLNAHISDYKKQAQLVHLVKLLLGSLFICLTAVFVVALFVMFVSYLFIYFLYIMC